MSKLLSRTLETRQPAPQTKRRSKAHMIFCAFLLLLLVAVPTLAQRTTASVRGVVKDAEGAIIPGVAVQVEGVETGFNRTTATNENGVYNFSGLQVGLYNIKVQLDGFQTALIENIELNVADIREVDIVLELGAITETITTTADTAPVETISGEVASLMSGEEIRELPLNGRNFVQLTQLMPGISAPDGLNFSNKGLLSGVDMSVSGSAVTGNNWSVDGASNNDTGSNRTILVYPSVDAIEEFKIHRNSYGPEFGGSGGAQINLVTRGGTNRFKGSAYAFYRNEDFNEKNHLLRGTDTDKEALDRKDYGFTLGGPVLKDRVHFFVSAERNDEDRGIVRTATVPTLAERQGDFSGSNACGNPVPINPTTGQPYPGNVIPDSDLSAGGLALLELYPAPNADGCLNWIDTVDTEIDWDQINARVDLTLNQKSQLLLRYTSDNWVNGSPNAGDTNGLWGDDPFPTVEAAWDQPGASLVAQLNQVIGSTSLNTVTFSMSGNEIDINRASGDELNSRINAAIPSFYDAAGKTGGDARSHPVYWGGATGRDLWNISPWQNELDIMSFKNDYEQVFGNHTVKAGILYSDASKLEDCCGGSSFETPHFWGGTGVGGWGATSGNRIADILIDGMYHGYDETEAQPSPELEWEDIEAYIGDSWRVNDVLTVDLGLRYSLFKDPVAVDNDIVAFYPELFDPALGNAPCNGIAQAPGATPCADAGLEGGGEGVSRSFVNEDDDNFAPRFGMAWDVFGTGKSVLRAGFGMFYQRERVNIQLDFGGQPPFVQNTSGIRPLDNADPTFLGIGFGVPTRGIDPNNVTPYNNQFNITWEQQLGPSTSVEIGYVGNRGRHLMRKVDINQVPNADLNGNGVNDRLDFIRGGGDGDGSVRPYFTGGGNRILYWMTDGESEYDGLQTQFSTRFGRGSIFQASYTFSRFKANDSLTSSSAGEENTQITDLSNPDLDWAYAGLHRDHVFNASLVWNGPDLGGSSAFMKHLFGNWSIGGIVQYASGSPITAYVADLPGLAGGGIAGTGYTGNNRPMRVDGVSCSGSGQQIINPDAFTLNGMLLGDTSQMSERNNCEGPDFFQVDLSFYKHFQITDRLNGQFRIEVFNFFDTKNYIGAGNTTIRPTNVVYDTGDAATATQIISADINQDFGLATAVRAPRQIQLGLKLTW